MALSPPIAIGDDSVSPLFQPPIKVVRLITGLEIGGAELGLLESIRHFDRNRFHFVVGCLYNNGSVGRKIEELGVPVFDMQMRWFGDPRGLLQLWQFLKTQKPDILHTHLFRANVWGRLLGSAMNVPVIISSEHSLTRGEIEGRQRTRLISTIDRCTARCCDKIIAVSEATKKYLLENSIPDKKIEVLFNAVDTRLFASGLTGAAIRREFGLGSGPLVTIVARLFPYKNHALLIEAFSRLHSRRADVKLLIVGDGPMENALRTQADATAPGAVTFAGARYDIPEIMAASDVVVLCSKCETFGKALVEAMAAGKPVIGTAVDGIPEVIVDGQTGILVPPEDGPALTQAMDRLLAERELAAAMGRAGQVRAQELFDIRKQVERLQEIYSELHGKYGIAARKNPGARSKRKDPVVAAKNTAGIENVPDQEEGEPLEVLCVCEPLAGGVPVYVEQLVRKLEGKHIRFTVACPAKSILRQRLAGSGVIVAEVNMHRGLNPITESRALLQLWGLIRSKRFDIVHLHSSKAGLLGRIIRGFWKVPTVLTPHCFSFESVSGMNAKFLSYLVAEKVLGKFTDVLVCVSTHERELALRHDIVPVDHIELIPCFVDLRRWTPSRLPQNTKSRLGIPANHKVVGTVSRFYRQKAPLDFARTAQLILRQRTNVTFLFIGEDGPLRSEFLEYLSNNGLEKHVILEPWTDDANYLTQFVAAMDVFVLNSLWEGSPLAIIEAMAMERPVIATDIPALREMVQEAGSGLLSSPGRPDLMALNILRVLDSPDLASILGSNGRREAITKYSLETISERHRKLYCRLAQAKCHYESESTIHR